MACTQASTVDELSWGNTSPSFFFTKFIVSATLELDPSRSTKLGTILRFRRLAHMYAVYYYVDMYYCTTVSQNKAFQVTKC